MRLKSIEIVDRPREKLNKYGADKLKDFELIAMILGSGTRGANVLQVAKKVEKLLRAKDVSHINSKLLSIKGIGAAKKAQILAIVELTLRLGPKKLNEIRGARDIWLQCADFRDLKKEHFVAFYIDSQGRLIDRKLVSIGTLTESLVHPREVFEPAVNNQSVGVIVAHNHPSGACEPSASDRLVTRRLIAAGDLMGIEILDHVIVTKGQYLSFKERGLLS